MLDDVIGPRFAVLCWNNDPRRLLGPEMFQRWNALGTSFIEARPLTQLNWTAAGRDPDPEVVVVGDRTGALKVFFDRQQDSVLFLRPDRCIAASCIAQLTPETGSALLEALGVVASEGGEIHGPTGSVLHVAQPAAESSGAAG